ncbi:hypothetical protein ARMGADRAFT_1018953 [Armillaria gallica]|uniref:Uncharacterized protein n=1 Tax=Armillaria gallica TaxID=47427 RepID=A0A2H3CKX7_ARMGA|nr:hypothetical protein ARMGADRAFT_1018953 [Armillaria gallica]
MHREECEHNMTIIQKEHTGAARRRGAELKGNKSRVPASGASDSTCFRSRQDTRSPKG